MPDDISIYISGAAVIISILSVILSIKSEQLFRENEATYRRIMEDCDARAETAANAAHKAGAFPSHLECRKITPGDKFIGWKPVDLPEGLPDCRPD